MNLEILREYFVEGGRLSRCFSSYEPRIQQLRMSEAVLNALSAGENLIVEAPTGVGKSLAYLVPLAGLIMEDEIERAVVSTYTKTLQRQLVEKDIPFLKQTLFPELTYTLCLGSENYLCLRRFNLTVQHGLFDLPDDGYLSEILRWSTTTETGLYLEIMPPTGVWMKVCREPDLCHGRACKYYSNCFYQKAKERERKSRLLVVNHHLFFANMASGWNVLSEFSHVVFDEAHEVERVASDYLGIEVSNTRLKYILDSVLSQRGKGILTRANISPERMQIFKNTIERVRMQAESFFSRLSEHLGNEKAVRIKTPGVFVDIVSEHLDALAEELCELAVESEDEELARDLRAVCQRCRDYIDCLAVVLNQELDGYVYWAEQEGRRLRLVATPLEPSEILSSQLFSVVESSVLTSATLTVGGSFRYIKERLGLKDAEECMLSSPFRYDENVLLYVSESVPDPDSEDYPEVLSREIQELLEITHGRTLVLFTSYSLLEEVLYRVKSSLVNILRQGDADNYRLIEEFKAREDTVLFGTYSFWQGIDIPGEALQCVIITKLPFSVPTEPVVEARMELLAMKGLDPFYYFQVPQAIITFKQGFGRLIRTSTDRGVVAVLDSRVLRRSYGRMFLNSIPEVEFTTDRQRVREFFRYSMVR